MATTRKKGDRGGEAKPEWDGAVHVESAAPVEAMPRRAAGLPSQNGGAMRAVFAYLLDEDDAPPPPSPPPVKGKRKG